MEKKRIEIEKWYDENEHIYEELAKQISELLGKLIKKENILCNDISYRKKDKKSYCDKAMKEKYRNPTSEIQDLAGVRIITYVNSDVKRICDIIEREFIIDKENSVNKIEELGTDKVGYMSIHYIARLSENRKRLLEYEEFGDLCFEIQVRTLLQHAWAEIEHDRNYKFGGVLPDAVKRKFSLIAGMLEMADMQFDEISNYIDNYSNQVNKDTINGDIKDIIIDSISLTQYLKNKFEKLITEGVLTPNFTDDESNKMAIEELRNFDVYTLGDLDNLININNDDYYYQCYKEQNEKINFIGLLRDKMIINDAKKYFKKSFKEHWSGTEWPTVNHWKVYEPDIEEILEENNIGIYDAI